MPFNFLQILLLAIPACLFVSISLLLVNWKTIATPFRYLGFYLVWNLLIETITWLPALRGMNNLPLLHLYTLVEFILFALFYKSLGIFKSWKPARFGMFISIISALIILNSIFIQSIYEFNSLAKTFVQVILIGFSMNFFFQLHEKTKLIQALNWVNAAVLIYYSGSLFIFMTGNFLTTGQNYFWMLNVMLNLVFQIMVFIAIWKASRIKKTEC